MKIKNVTYLFCLLMITISCSYEKLEPASKTECEPIDTVSFSRNIIPIFNQHCNGSGCHSGTNPAGNLNLEASQAYAQLMNSSSGYIDTINPRYSVLHASMNSSSNPMPPSGKLDKCTLDRVLKWIQQKAKNN